MALQWFLGALTVHDGDRCVRMPDRNRPIGMAGKSPEAATKPIA